MTKTSATKKVNEFPAFSVSTGGAIFNSITGERLTYSVDKWGYFSVRFKLTDGKRARRMVHNLIARAFIPNPKNKPHINHRDFNPSNNIIENLEWVTPEENSRHSMLFGRKSKKLTIEKVRQIRGLLDSGMSQYKVAKKIGINQSCVSDIVTGVAWSWSKQCEYS